LNVSFGIVRGIVLLDKKNKKRGDTTLWYPLVIESFINP